ncbi:MAG: acyl-CoA thioesterase [Desulfovibrionaceae bacterium]|nr:acyl-CoA thioesterase [Desulfovibrionaceae bacterium]
MHTLPSPNLYLPHRVSYGETDTMGFVYYAEYLHYFERARSAYIRQCGLSYAEIEKRDIFLPVREANCRYKRPARYDDLIYIGIAISEWGRASLRFVYEIVDANQELYTTGMTQHALINKAGKLQAVPAWFKDLCSNLQVPNPREPLY